MTHDQIVASIVRRIPRKKTRCELTLAMMDLEKSMPDVANDPRVIKAKQEREQQIKEKQQ